MFCGYCKKDVDPVLTEMGADSPHYAKAECPKCFCFLRWMPKPQNDGIRKKASKYTPDSLDINYCEICGRTLHTVGAKEVLEIHHKVPVSEGGEDKKENILVVCSACHKMCRWLRLYLNQHINQSISLQEEDSSLPF